MRVKLTYTADIKEVLAEAANLLVNLDNKINTSAELFRGTIVNLQSDRFNSGQMHHDVDLLRNQLGELDIRLLEVLQIVDGYEQYEREARSAPAGAPPDWALDSPEAQNGSPQQEEEEDEENNDY